MNSSNFYLKGGKAKSNTSIILTLNYSGYRLRIPTGKAINPNLWNKQKQRAKANGYPQNADLNDFLDEMATIINSIYNDFVRNNITPPPTKLKKVFFDTLKRNKTKPINKKTNFWKIFDEFVEYKKQTVSKGVVKDYNNSLRKHLKEVEKQLNRKLRFSDFKNQHKGFITKFDFYLNNVAQNSKGSQGLMTNTIGKQYKNIKSFLNYCFNKGIIERFSLIHLVTISEEPYNVFLTNSELDRIIKLKIEDEKLDAARDLFILSSNTGFRFGDLMTLKPVHIQDRDIRKRTIKDGPIVTIPINSIVRKILKKHNNNIPKPDNITEFNHDIRTITKMAKINNSIEVIYTLGKTKETEVFKKYELVSSHTGRRSFCSNHYLKGMPTEAIMVFSGHKSVKSFMKYLKLNSELAANKYRDVFFQ